MNHYSLALRSGQGMTSAAEALLGRMRPVLGGGRSNKCKSLRRKPMTIEFVGHAGSGKTFLRDRLVEALGEDYQVAWKIQVRGRDLGVYVALHPRIVLDTLVLVLSSRPKSFRSGVKALTKLLFYHIKRENCAREGAEVMIFDEGMLHRLRMLRSNSAAGSVGYADIKPRVRRRLFPRPDLVIFVVASLETMARRKVTRDAIPGGETIEEMIRRKRGNYGRLIQRTENDIQVARQEQGFRYLTIYNEADAPVAGNLRRILDEITALEEDECAGRAQ